MRSDTRPRGPRRPGTRLTAAATLGVALFGLAAMPGCATRVAAPTEAHAALGDPPREALDALIGQWQQQLADYVAGPGLGDPGALAQLPTLRSPAVMRPAQIIFCAIDIDASTSERDGYDICGLMLGNVERAGEPRYLFAVGVVARSDYRPAAIADVRLVAISPRQGTLSWQVGGADPQALDRYRRRFSPAAVPRFPALEDRFSIAPCGAGVCATELVSGARWALQF